MTSPLLLLPFLCGLVNAPHDADACDLLVRVEEHSGRPAPPGLWVRAQFVGGPAVAAPLEPGGTALRTRCGLHRVEVGSPAADPERMESPRSELLVHALAEDTVVTRLDRVTEQWLYLPPSAELGVEVVGARGNPLAGFQLDARSADRRSGVSLVTGKDGRASFRGELGPYDLHWLQGDVRRISVDGIERRDAPREPLPVRLTASGLTVSIFMGDVGPASGTIRTIEGKPLPGVQVRVEQPGVAVAESASTDRRGEFLKPLARAPLTLRPLAPSGGFTFDPPATPCARVPCTASFTACPADVGCLRLRVVSDADGEAVAGAAFAARATCAGGAPGFAVSGETDDEGRARVPCPRSCALSLRVLKHGWLEKSERLGPLGCAEEHTLRLSRGAVLRGRVLDEEGRSAAALAVRASLGDWTWSGPSLTDAEGRFAIEGVPPGFQRVQLDDDGDARALALCDGARCRAAGLEVARAQAPDLDLRLVQGGRVCATARPGQRPCLRVHPADAEDLVASAQGSWGQASACSGPLPAGDYRVRLDCPAGDGDGAPVWAQQQVRVVAGETVRLAPRP